MGYVREAALIQASAATLPSSSSSLSSTFFQTSLDELVSRCRADLSISPAACEAASQTEICSLADQLQVEQQISEPARAVPVPAQLKCVVNIQNSIWHACLVGEADGAPSDEWLTQCGWAFGLAKRWRYEERSAIPQCWKVLCSKCFPEERAARKSVVSQTLKRRVG